MLQIKKKLFSQITKIDQENEFSTLEKSLFVIICALHIFFSFITVCYSKDIPIAVHSQTCMYSVFDFSN